MPAAPDRRAAGRHATGRRAAASPAPAAGVRPAAARGHAVAARTALEPDVDRMSIAALRCQCHIGVTEAERSTRQRIEIDLDLWADLEEAGRTAELARTIDYRDVAEDVRSLCEGRPFHLVEAMARAVLDRVFERFARVSRVNVRVRKYVLRDVGHVEIAMERRR
jgi:7,8-dihydroneopterin aldolase/epimerase/oxygenase